MSRLTLPHCLGPAIGFTRSAAVSILQTAKNTEFYKIDDVYISGVLRYKAQIPLIRYKAITFSRTWKLVPIACIEKSTVAYCKKKSMRNKHLPIYRKPILLCNCLRKLPKFLQFISADENYFYTYKAVIDEFEQFKSACWFYS